MKIHTTLCKPSFVAVSMLAAWCIAFSAPEKQNPEKAKQLEKSKSGIQKMIFEEQKIEGKIRRPQMVLIKADQRPNFPAMIMQTSGKNDNVAATIDPSIIESPTYQGAFQFKGTAIINYVP